MLREHGVGLVSQRDGVRASTPTGRLIFHILGSIAEWDRENIIERTRMGRERVAADGKWTGGPAPYGYSTDDRGRLVLREMTVPQFDGMP